MKAGMTANDYRQTARPIVEQPKPKESGISGAEYPKHVKCFDGVIRVAEHAAHEDALVTGKSPVLVESLPAPEPTWDKIEIPNKEFVSMLQSGAVEADNFDEIRCMASAGEPLIRGPYLAKKPIDARESVTVAAERVPADNPALVEHGFVGEPVQSGIPQGEEA